MPYLLFLLFSCFAGATHSDTGETVPDTEVSDTSSDTGQTGTEDTGTEDTGPKETGCEAALTTHDAVSLPVEASLGDFTVSVTPDGDLVVTHAASGTRELFAGPSSGPWLSLGQADFHAEEHQGSFDLEENISLECRGLRLDSALYGRDTLVLEGGFEDGGLCDTVTWRARVCEIGSGRLSLRVTSDDPSFDVIWLRAASPTDERIFGLGEQVPHTTLDLKGREISVISQEGGVGRGHPIIAPVVDLASEGSAGSEDSTYYAAPHYLTDQGRSLFLEDTEVSIFDFQSSQTAIRLFASELNAQVLQGEDPLEQIERFTDYAGRMPAPPAWAGEGAIVALAQPLNESQELLAELLDAGAAIAAVWNQTWSGQITTYIGEQVRWNWVLDEDKAEEWHTFVDTLEGQGIRTLCYVNSMFYDVSEEEDPPSRNLFQEAKDAGHLVKNAAGGTYALEITAFQVGLLDLSSEPARTWMKQIIQDELLTNAGCSGWMADFAEALPYDAVMASGESAASWHNRYPVEWARLNKEALEEVGALGDVLVWNRSGFTTSPGHALMFWQGDQLTTWDEYDGLVSAIHGLISGGFSGLALNHSDIGGYTSLSLYGLGYDREEEQLQRWLEMSAFTALFRTHEGNQPDLNYQVYSNSTTRDHFALFSNVYAALSDYRKELFLEAETLGWPVVRHLGMHFPDDAQSWEVSDQFLLGSEVLVAPIKNKCWTWPWCPYDKTLYLPPGEWVHLWSGETYGDGTGTEVTVQAPLGEPAVFYRKGSTMAPGFVQALRDRGIEVADAR